MKKILVTGATGAMGAPLVEILSQHPDYEVYATSRNPRKKEGIRWIEGNAKDSPFFEKLLLDFKFDAIVDFMNYTTREFEKRHRFILDNTQHYIFTSSARVYARTDEIISEKTDRILDVCTDSAYLARDSYDLAKARQENMLMKSSKKNWTVIRPSLTYNDRRLQFTIFELQEWIYRYLDNNSIIFPTEIGSIMTTMTHGQDVARIVDKLVLNEDAKEEIFNVSGGGSLTWQKVLQVYKRAIEEKTHRPVKICEVDGVEEIAKHLNRYDQYRFARGINRVFSNSKIESLIGSINYTSIEDGLRKSIQSYIVNPDHILIPFRTGAYFDKLAHEITPLRRFDSPKHRIGYILGRLGVVKV